MNKQIFFTKETYYWARAQPNISNVKPTEAKNAKRTTLNQTYK